MNNKISLNCLSKIVKYDKLIFHLKYIVMQEAK